jgi:hypothetical protein
MLLWEEEYFLSIFYQKIPFILEILAPNWHRAERKKITQCVILAKESDCRGGKTPYNEKALLRQGFGGYNTLVGCVHRSPKKA